MNTNLKYVERFPLRREMLTVGAIEWWPNQRCAAHLHVGCADLGFVGLLSKDLHANWPYWIHLSVMCFHEFKNWRRQGSLLALSWQFDSGFIIRAWFYNKQELSCLIRHARWRSLYPNPTLDLLQSPLPPSNASLGEERRGGRGLNPLTTSWWQSKKNQNSSSTLA